MFWIYGIGIIIAIINVGMTYLELIPFLDAVHHLNHYSKANNSFKNRFLYSFRFISLLPKASPCLLDIGINIAATAIGMGSGLLGALTGQAISLVASILVRVYRLRAKKLEANNGSWKAITAH